MRKTLSLLLVFQLFFLCLLAQTTVPGVDKSPMDMSYYPASYPVLKIQDKANEPLVARVTYSRPQKAGRTIFGELIKYNEIWRLGANEATEINFFTDVKIGGKKVNKGRYTAYAIVNENNTWTFIINKDTDTWGAFKYNKNKDVARVTAPAQKMENIVEYFSMYFEKSATGFNLVVVWDNMKCAMPITLN
jgi:hypothetical protein